MVLSANSGTREGKPQVEEYGLDELAASAESVLAGLGPLAAGLARLADQAGRAVTLDAMEVLVIEQGRELGLRRIFVLTFEEHFFARHGFAEIDGTPVPPDVFAAMLRSYDAGVAEFLDLAHVKPNTLGNVRMLLQL